MSTFTIKFNILDNTIVNETIDQVSSKMLEIVSFKATHVHTLTTTDVADIPEQSPIKGSGSEVSAIPAQVSTLSQINVSKAGQLLKINPKYVATLTELAKNLFVIPDFQGLLLSTTQFEDILRNTIHASSLMSRICVGTDQAHALYINVYNEYAKLIKENGKIDYSHITITTDKYRMFLKRVSRTMDHLSESTSPYSVYVSQDRAHHHLKVAETLIAIITSSSNVLSDVETCVRVHTAYHILMNYIKFTVVFRIVSQEIRSYLATDLYEHILVPANVKLSVYYHTTLVSRNELFKIIRAKYADIYKTPLINVFV